MVKTIFTLLTIALLQATLQTQAAESRIGPIRPADYPEKIRVACVGDSITYGMGIEKRNEQSYPAQLQQLLGPRWVVTNFGFNGATLLKVSQKPYWNLDVYKRVMVSRPDVVIIALGTNDAHPPTWSEHKGEFVADYKAMIAAFAALPSKPRIWICRPVPLIPGRDDMRMKNLREDILPMIAQVGKDMQVPIIDLYQPLDGKPELFPDKVHPNAAGAAIMAEIIFTAITGESPPR